MGHSAQSELIEWANATLYSTSTATNLISVLCCWPPKWFLSCLRRKSWTPRPVSSVLTFLHVSFFQHAQEEGEGRAEANDASTQNVLRDQAPRLAARQPLIITVMAGQDEESLMKQNRRFGAVSSMWSVKEVSLLGRPWVCRWRTGKGGGGCLCW